MPAKSDEPSRVLAHTGPFPFAVDVMISGREGLRARSAIRFSEVANRFLADIRIHFAGKVANAKSLPSLLTLAVASGDVIRILARGEGAEAALEALEQALAGRLVPGDAGAERQDNGQARAGASYADIAPTTFSGDLRRGAAAATGVAIAPAFVLEQTAVRIIASAGGYQDERNKLLRALSAGRGDLQKLGSDLAARAASKDAAVFRAQLAIIDDGALLEEANAFLKKGLSAGVAVQEAMDRRAKELSALNQAAAAQDVREVLERVLRFLAGEGATKLMKRLPEHPVILVAHDLTAYDRASLDPRRVLGIVTIAGSPSSPTAQLAKSLGIPCVVGCGSGIRSQSQLIVDGDAGIVVVNPSASDLALAKTCATERAASIHRSRLEAWIRESNRSGPAPRAGRDRS